MKAKELLDENYKLRRKLDTFEVKHIKYLISILKLIDKEKIDLRKIINGFELELENMQ